MPKRIEAFPEEAWLRRCQECDNVQTDTEPEYGKELSKAYLERKCKKCKSESLDYGTGNYDNGE